MTFRLENLQDACPANVFLSAPRCPAAGAALVQRVTGYLGEASSAGGDRALLSPAPGRLAR